MENLIPKRFSQYSSAGMKLHSILVVLSFAQVCAALSEDERKWFRPGCAENYGLSGYAIGAACKHGFLICQRYGSGYLRSTFKCPEGLVFPPLLNVNSPQCVYPEEVADCRRGKDRSRWYANRVYFKRYFTCENRPNGVYGLLPYGQIYPRCTNGTMTVEDCGNERTYYSPEHKCIDDSTYDTYNLEPTNATKYDKPPLHNLTREIIFEATVDDRSLTCNASTPLPTTNGTCSKRFWICPQEGVDPVIFFCPEGLFFDEPRQTCDFYTHVPVCFPYPAAAAHVENPKETLDCQGRADGFYGFSSRSPVYFQCRGNLSVAMVCPKDHFFNSTLNTCDFHIPRLTQLRLNGHSMDKKAIAFCKNSTNANGFLEEGECVDHYIRCLRGLPFKMRCPKGFSFADNICVWHNVCLGPMTMEPLSTNYTKQNMLMFNLLVFWPESHPEKFV
ncbi:hypothetical protein QR680_007262 [Steinernema hermaphroditum]|uniref:Chitin-binding type-2 domain-containing protein n=1 Tax=Steinernema hermaphroditum TaxID=289476 RepID=A0AA39LXY2_9BILA|nr:hypothetical protein QR680_007262 [Steinernema hermaphroditum]